MALTVVTASVFVVLLKVRLELLPNTPLSLNWTWVLLPAGEIETSWYDHDPLTFINCLGMYSSLV